MSRPVGAPAAGPTADPAQETSNTPHCAEPQSIAPTDRKTFERLRADAAMLGAGLYELASGSYLLPRWAMTRELPDLQAVAALLRQMGGAR